jgi:hypothetical protein
MSPGSLVSYKTLSCVLLDQLQTRPSDQLKLDITCNAGRWIAKKLADAGLEWSRRAASRMPEARGDIREIVGEPVFVPLYTLFRAYGPIFRLSFGPQSFVVISDPAMAKQVQLTRPSGITIAMVLVACFFVIHVCSYTVKAIPMCHEFIDNSEHLLRESADSSRNISSMNTINLR